MSDNNKSMKNYTACKELVGFSHVSKKAFIVGIPWKKLPKYEICLIFLVQHKNMHKNNLSEREKKRMINRYDNFHMIPYINPQTYRLPSPQADMSVSG